jgi:hypothetical protein
MRIDANFEVLRCLGEACSNTRRGGDCHVVQRHAGCCGGAAQGTTLFSKKKPVRMQEGYGACSCVAAHLQLRILLREEQASRFLIIVTCR